MQILPGDRVLHRTPARAAAGSRRATWRRRASTWPTAATTSATCSTTTTATRCWPWPRTTPAWPTSTAGYPGRRPRAGRYGRRDPVPGDACLRGARARRAAGIPRHLRAPARAVVSRGSCGAWRASSNQGRAQRLGPYPRATPGSDHTSLRWRPTSRWGVSRGQGLVGGRRPSPIPEPFWRSTVGGHARVQARLRLHPDRRPAQGDRRPGRGRGGGRALSDAARGDGHGQDDDDGRRDRGGSAPDARDRPQQDARGAAVQRVPDVLPGQRGRVLRVLLRLLPARGVRSRAATCTSRRTRRSTRRSTACATPPPRRCSRAAT